MIIELKSGITGEKAEELARSAKAFCINDGEKFLLVNASSAKEISPELETFAEKVFRFNDDMQLSSRSFRQNTRNIVLDDICIGDGRHTVLMAGPCSVESETQINASAHLLRENGLKILRAGAYKPRTSPYTFSGMGRKGLELLAEMRAKYGLKIISEVRDATHVEEVMEWADIIQIGAKSMYDHGLLNRCAKSNKPVLIKRGFGSTLQELVQAAEFVLSGGNPNVMLCERGIRTFETKTRFTLDLCGVAWLKEYCNLPVILDPSHAMGYAYGVPGLSRACVAMGVDGLLIEVHPEPQKALSDASQQLDHFQFSDLVASLHPVAAAVNRKIV